MPKQSILVIVGVDGGNARKDTAAFNMLTKSHSGWHVLTGCGGCDPNNPSRNPFGVEKIRGVWVLKFDSDKAKKDWFKQKEIDAFFADKIYFIHATDASCPV
jgi:hypothetical protein